LEPIIFRFGGLALVELLVLARPARFSASASSKFSHNALDRACSLSWLTRKILSIKSLPARDDRL
jgi:hypothetical protein